MVSCRQNIFGLRHWSSRGEWLEAQAVYRDEVLAANTQHTLTQRQPRLILSCRRVLSFGCQLTVQLWCSFGRNSARFKYFFFYYSTIGRRAKLQTLERTPAVPFACACVVPPAPRAPEPRPSSSPRLFRASRALPWRPSHGPSTPITLACAALMTPLRLCCAS